MVSSHHALSARAGKSSWDLYDTFGIRKTKTSYEFIGSFNGKFFPARNRGYRGVLDRYGVERIACVYDSIIAIKDDLVVVGFQGQYGIITIEDQWQLLPQKKPIELLGDNRFGERKDSLFLMKDFTGNVFYFTDNPVEVFPDHLLERLPDGTLKEINFQGQIVSRKAPVVPQKEQAQAESEGLIGIQRDGKFGFVDTRGRLRIANRYEAIGEFRDSLAAVKLLGKWGFINALDQIVIQPTYESVENFNHGVSIVSRKGKYGLIDAAGKELLALRYDSIRRLADQFFLLSLDSLKGLADATGRVQIEPRFDQLRYANGGVVIVSREGKFGSLTTSGLSTLPLVYDTLVYDKKRSRYLARKKSEWVRIDF